MPVHTRKGSAATSPDRPTASARPRTTMKRTSIDPKATMTGVAARRGTAPGPRRPRHPPNSTGTPPSAEPSQQTTQAATSAVVPPRRRGCGSAASQRRRAGRRHRRRAPGSAGSAAADCAVRGRAPFSGRTVRVAACQGPSPRGPAGGCVAPIAGWSRSSPTDRLVRPPAMPRRRRSAPPRARCPSGRRSTSRGASGPPRAGELETETGVAQPGGARVAGHDRLRPAVRTGFGRRTRSAPPPASAVASGGRRDEVGNEGKPGGAR